MKKRISVPLSGKGIDQLIREVEAYQRWLKERTEIFLDRLAQEGLQIASVKFEKAVYDGTNDVSVSVEMRGPNARSVVALGRAVLFIEFGTGVVYPDNYPEAQKHGMERGKYGMGHGSQQKWGYYGDPGSNGVTVVKPNGKEVVITQGNPSNMPMYETVKELKERISLVAKEVFS